MSLRLTVTDGVFKDASFFQKVGIQGRVDAKNVNNWSARGKVLLKALIDGMQGTSPDDRSGPAELRRVFVTSKGWVGLHDRVVSVLVGVREQEGYPEENFIDHVITPDRKVWKKSSVYCVPL